MILLFEFSHLIKKIISLIKMKLGQTKNTVTILHSQYRNMKIIRKWCILQKFYASFMEVKIKASLG